MNLDQDDLDAIAAALGGAGTGATAVTQDTGGVDNLRFVTSTGIGIEDAVVVAFLKSDWDAGNISSAYRKGSTRTNVNGRWIAPLMLDADNTYTIMFYKSGLYEVSTSEVTI